MTRNGFWALVGGVVSANNSGDKRLLPLAADMAVGSMLFYDRKQHEYKVCAPEMVGAVLADYDSSRYETNHDTFIGIAGDTARFVAKTDATPNTGLYDDRMAATACFYRIEIDNTVDGSITFSATSGNATLANSTVSWAAGEAMTDIVARFLKNEKSNINFKALADGRGVGVAVGGYGVNTLTATETENCTVIDCSELAFYLSQNPGVKMGDTFNPEGVYNFLGKGVHRSFLSANPLSIIPDRGLITNNAYCEINLNRLQRGYIGLNFSKWRGVTGASTFLSDFGSTVHLQVMNEDTFNAEVANYTGDDSVRLEMKEYYTHLFTDQSGEFVERRAKYEAMYGQMTSMYDGYLMSHMIKIDATGGITYTMLGHGKNQTAVKGDCMNVNYDYVIIPAYPPEYNATHYGIEGSEGFAPSTYYHPEPVDLGLMLRDDVLLLVKSNIEMSGGRTTLNSAPLGTCASYWGYDTWYYSPSNGSLTETYRYSPYFISRPMIALPIKK